MTGVRRDVRKVASSAGRILRAELGQGNVSGMVFTSGFVALR
jgi:hypothetical protein